ncbi:hypothetical protein SOVF_148460 [Spinacia oleracea]|uniref:Uncharacterized protein n=1 Tax=Spinacia oleracea TaxID=3562 RepID=A0A9R0J3J3_SPIOL|nr:uncharacterized protein LOC110799766 [Spinacia oleracea]KNA09992.1 hypothetical protein SOVF_148460 [Spinacia oleracea]
MESPIIGAISFLKSCLSPSKYEEAKQALIYVESSLKRDEAEITRKLDNAIKESHILSKQLKHYKDDHAESLLASRYSEHELDKSRNECAQLQAGLLAARQEVQRLKDEEVKFGNLSTEAKMLKKQNMYLREENVGLEAAVAKSEEKLRDCRLVCEGLKGKIKELEEEMAEKVKQAEIDGAENLKLKMKNSKLKADLEGVIEAATARFRSFETRLLDLEHNVAILNHDDAGSDSDSQVSQLADATQDVQEHGSFGLEAKCEGQSGHETATVEEKKATTLPSQKATSATSVQGHPSGPAGTRSVSETRVAEKKSAPTQCVPKPSVVDLCSSDDDDELPSPKGLKRKLPSSEFPSGNRTHSESASSSKKAMEAEGH